MVPSPGDHGSLQSRTLHGYDVPQPPSRFNFQIVYRTGELGGETDHLTRRSKDLLRPGNPSFQHQSQVVLEAHNLPNMTRRNSRACRTLTLVVECTNRRVTADPASDCEDDRASDSRDEPSSSQDSVDRSALDFGRLDKMFSRAYLEDPKVQDIL